MIEDMWRGQMSPDVRDVFQDVRDEMASIQEEVCIRCGKKSPSMMKRCPHCGDCKGGGDD